MNTVTDLPVFTQTSFDSGALSGLGAVVHRLTQSGEHRVTVLQGEKAIQTFPLRVLAMPAQPPAGPLSAPAPRPFPAAGPVEVHVDLGRALAAPGQVTPLLPGDLAVVEQGYAVFHAPPGSSGLAVQLNAPQAETGAPIFDSRKLQNGDIFAVTLLRPGRYSLTNTLHSTGAGPAPGGTGAQGEIRVAYPVIGDKPYRPPDPLQVQVGEGGFQPNSIQLQPVQGLIFHVGNVAARIQIELVEPDDGPPAGGTGAKVRGPLFRWERPAPPTPG
jgi:hypothetical protein